MGRKKLTNEYGKHRTYECPNCGYYCLRQLRYQPTPCRHCYQELLHVPYVLDDAAVAARLRKFQGKDLS